VSRHASPSSPPRTSADSGKKSIILSFNQCCGSGSGSRRAKMTHRKIEKVLKFHFWKCWMFSLEGWRLLL
jgi:hypothetical protein